MNKLKLIVTDLDGTLLNEEKKVPCQMEELIKKCINEGIVFGLASGRQMASLELQFPNIKDSLLYISENGTYSKYKGQKYTISFVDRSLLPELIKKARTVENCYAVYSAPETTYIESDDPGLLVEINKAFVKYEIVDDLLAIQDECCKMSLCDLDGVENNCYEVFKKYEDRLQVTVSSEKWIDMCVLGQSKGNVVATFQKEFNITHDETMVFGDYLNDVTMMKQAYYSYAMKNAHPALKEVARFVTLSNEEEAVAKVVEDYLENRMV